MSKVTKMNLLILAKNKELSTRLIRYVENENAEKCRTFLMKYFHGQSIRYGHDRLVMEMADLFASLYDDPDIEQTLYDYSESVQNRITHYHKKKEEASKTLSKVYRRSKTNYVQMSREERAAIGYTPETVSELLKQLDAKENYARYIDGYEFERYRMYEWLRYHINEALSGRTHIVRDQKEKKPKVESFIPSFDEEVDRSIREEAKQANR